MKDAGEGFIHGGTYPLNSKTLCKGDLTGLEIDEKKNTIGSGFSVELESLNRFLMRRRNSKFKEKINRNVSFFFRYEALICSVGLNVLEVSF